MDFAVPYGTMKLPDDRASLKSWDFKRHENWTSEMAQLVKGACCPA